MRIGGQVGAHSRQKGQLVLPYYARNEVAISCVREGQCDWKSEGRKEMMPEEWSGAWLLRTSETCKINVLPPHPLILSSNTFFSVVGGFSVELKIPGAHKLPSPHNLGERTRLII